MNPLDAPLPWALPLATAAFVLSLPASRPVGRWLGAPRTVGWVLVMTLGLILAGTLTPLVRDGAVPVDVGHVCDLSRIGLPSLRDLKAPSDVVGNILMFVPVGFAIALAPGSWRRAAAVAGAIALPFAIEATQLLVTQLHRGCESADVVDNLTGLAIGLAAGALVSRLGVAVRRAARHDI